MNPCERIFTPRPASRSEAGLFYALKPELDELLGGVGHYSSKKIIREEYTCGPNLQGLVTNLLE